MLAVTDSRFQAELARQAKDAGKLPKNFEIPAAYRDNHPERIAGALKPARDAGLLPSFPFGSDFTEAEQRLIPGVAVVAGRAACAAAPGRIVVAGIDPPARCSRRGMPGAARSRPAGNMVRTCLPCAGQRGAGQEPYSMTPVVRAGCGDPLRTRAFGNVAEAFYDQQSQGLWVPAFAGTTRGETCAFHLFLFTGLRLAMNAAMPSDRSSSAKVE